MCCVAVGETSTTPLLHHCNHSLPGSIGPNPLLNQFKTHPHDTNLRNKPRIAGGRAILSSCWEISCSYRLMNNLKPTTESTLCFICSPVAVRNGLQDTEVVSSTECGCSGSVESNQLCWTERLVNTNGCSTNEISDSFGLKRYINSIGFSVPFHLLGQSHSFGKSRQIGTNSNPS